MIERLNPEYRFTCDRCGAVEFGNEEKDVYAYPINFSNGARVVNMGVICRNCYAEFCEIAENFFDEVNKNG